MKYGVIFVGNVKLTHPRLTTDDLAAGPPLEGRPPAPTLVAELGAGIAIRIV